MHGAHAWHATGLHDAGRTVPRVPPAACGAASQEAREASSNSRVDSLLRPKAEGRPPKCYRIVLGRWMPGPRDKCMGPGDSPPQPLLLVPCAPNDRPDCIRHPPGPTRAPSCLGLSAVGFPGSVSVGPAEGLQATTSTWEQSSHLIPLLLPVPPAPAPHPGRGPWGHLGLRPQAGAWLRYPGGRRVRQGVSAGGAGAPATPGAGPDTRTHPTHPRARARRKQDSGNRQRRAALDTKL